MGCTGCRPILLLVAMVDSEGEVNSCGVDAARGACNRTAAVLVSPRDLELTLALTEFEDFADTDGNIDGTGGADAVLVGAGICVADKIL